MSKLGDIAKKTLGTTTVKIDDIIRDYDGVVTINGISYTEYKGDKIPVFSFAEGAGMSFWGGCKKLRELADAWQEDYGDLRAVNEELAVEGVRIRLSPTTRTKNGNPFRPVAIIGTVKFDEVEPELGEQNIDEDTGELFNEAEEAPF